MCKNCLFQLRTPLQKRTCSKLFSSSTTTMWSLVKGADNCGEVCGLPVSCRTSDISWVKSAFPCQLIWSYSLVALWSVLVPGGLPCSGGGVCGGVWWSQLLFCCGSSGGFMLCLASVMDHFWCAEPVSNLVTRHLLNTSPCHLHNIWQPWKDHVSQICTPLLYIRV